MVKDEISDSDLEREFDQLRNELSGTPAKKNDDKKHRKDEEEAYEPVYESESEFDEKEIEKSLRFIDEYTGKEEVSAIKRIERSIFRTLSNKWVKRGLYAVGGLSLGLLGYSFYASQGGVVDQIMINPSPEAVPVFQQLGIKYPNAITLLKPVFANTIAPMLGSLVGYYAAKKDRMKGGAIIGMFLGLGLSAVTSLAIPNGPAFSQLLNYNNSQYASLVPKEIADAINQGYIAYNWDNPLGTRGVVPLLLTMSGYFAGLVGYFYKLKLGAESRGDYAYYAQRFRKKLRDIEDDERRAKYSRPQPVPAKSQ